VVAALHIGPRRKEPLHPVETISAVAGRGLEGDRFYRTSGGDENPNPSREITLIESEALEGIRDKAGLDLTSAQSRRNVLTRGVPLNHLVGRQFRVGTAVLEGLELCEPCGHLELLTRAGVKTALLHRGGLRARIVESGPICVGDLVEPLESQ
jgi:MOSC domain-containing protein YiiM